MPAPRNLPTINYQLCLHGNLPPAPQHFSTTETDLHTLPPAIAARSGNKERREAMKGRREGGYLRDWSGGGGGGGSEAKRRPPATPGVRGEGGWCGGGGGGSGIARRRCRRWRMRASASAARGLGWFIIACAQAVVRWRPGAAGRPGVAVTEEPMGGAGLSTSRALASLWPQARLAPADLKSSLVYIGEPTHKHNLDIGPLPFPVLRPIDRDLGLGMERGIACSCAIWSSRLTVIR